MVKEIQNSTISIIKNSKWFNNKDKYNAIKKVVFFLSLIIINIFLD